MKKVFIFILLLVQISLFSQNSKLGYSITMIAEGPQNDASFLVYSPTLKIKALYTDSTQAKNKLPEELVMSVLSANSQDWINYNFLGRNARKKKPEHFQGIKTMDREKNYFELCHKYEYNLNGIPTAIIKYFIIFEGLNKPLSAYIEMQKIGDRWYQTAIPNNAEFGAMFMRFNSDKLNFLLTGKDTNDTMINEVRTQIKRPDGSIDLKKLYQIYNSWYENNPEKVDYFIDKNAW